MNRTSIEWTDSTWNPLRGCSRVSEGCRHCYAEREANRHKGPGGAYEGLVQLVNGHPAWTGKVTFVEKHLLDPLKWGAVLDPDAPIITRVLRDGAFEGARIRRRRIFVNSMSDLFHENVPDAWIKKIFAVMALCPHHDFQILTKRAERMSATLGSMGVGHQILDLAESIALSEINTRNKTWGQWLQGKPIQVSFSSAGTKVRMLERIWPLPNVWLGVSVENQKAADERIPPLLRTPASVRFISAEPLLGPINLEQLTVLIGTQEARLNSISDYYKVNEELSRLDWVIAGGESGPEARSMHPDWVRSLRDQCLPAGTAFFFKQWGAWVPTKDPGVAKARGIPLGDCMSWVGRKKIAGAVLDGREWRQFPQVSRQ